MDRLISEAYKINNEQEAIRELEIMRKCFKSFSVQYQALSMAIEALAIPSADTWIPVSERLPEETGEYLCWVKREQEEPYIDIEQIDCDGMIKEWNMVKPWEVIAWMPLPSPYKGEQP